ncbi:unnamed protein product [Clonostachys rosea f. rosea IK726]|uniref:Uncharacterized protein n=2 Tax=Bionectria ochroleuca TaxID=29856 RepID=A0A0B7KA74_BIOOC|nr:unnamed protein product [Clonostachys rosea f. rosea IK726]
MSERMSVMSKSIVKYPSSESALQLLMGDLLVGLGFFSLSLLLGFCSGRCRLVLLWQIDNHLLGQLLLLAVTETDGIQPGLDALEIEVSLVLFPPLSLGIDGNELDFVGKTEGGLERRDAFNFA